HRVAVDHEVFDSRVYVRISLARRQAKIGQTDDFALTHWNAAKHLRQEFADADTDQKILGFGELSRPADTVGISGELPHRFDISGKPREPMGGALLAIKKVPGDLTL